MQHQVVSRDEWTKARLDLLEAEKELTRRSDELRTASAGTAVGAGR